MTDKPASSAHSFTEGSDEPGGIVSPASSDHPGRAALAAIMEAAEWARSTGLLRHAGNAGAYVASLEAENARLREALRPFADAAREQEKLDATRWKETGDGWREWFFTYNEIKAALAALGGDNG